MKKKPYKTILKITKIFYDRLTNINSYDIEKTKDIINDFEDLKTASEEIIIELKNFKPEEIDELDEKKSILEYISKIDKLVFRLNKIPSFW